MCARCRRNGGTTHDTDIDIDMKHWAMELAVHDRRLGEAELAESLRRHRHDFTPSLTDEFIKNYSRKWSGQACHLFCTDADGNVKALLVYYANRLPFIYTTHVWIDRSCRRQGYCAALFSLAERLSREKGFTAHMLEVADDNAGAAAAYEKLGFELFEKRDRSSILKKDIVMTK